MNLKKFFALGLVACLVLVLTLVSLQTNVYAADGQGPNLRAAANNWNNCWYTVRYGDTLFSIAVRYGVSWVTLAQINGLSNPNLIYAGMTLALPCGYPPYPPRPPYPPTPCTNSTTYIVKPGDNLFRIALNFGTSVNALRDANNLWGKVLYAGTKLVIPCSNATPTPPPDSVPLQPLTAPTQMPAGTPEPQNQQGNTELAPEPSASVTLQNSQVNPASVTIKVGQSVLWTNTDQNDYTIVSGIPGQPNDLFASPAIPSGGTFVNTFSAAGNYSYFISENPSMIGQVNVTP